MNEPSLGVGLYISTFGVRSAITCNEDLVQPLVHALLPVMYLADPETGRGKPAGMSDWLSEKHIRLDAEAGAAETVMAKEVIRRTANSVLERAGQILGRNIDFVCVTVAPSLGERDRARLRAIIKDLGYEVQLLNEDQALIKSDLDLREAESLLIYNLRHRTVEISWYLSSDNGPTLERLEVLTDCGLDFLDMGLLSALLKAGGQAASNLQHLHAMLEAVREARSLWKPGEILAIPAHQQLGLAVGRLPDEHVSAVFEAALGSSFETAWRVMGDGAQNPYVVLASHDDESSPYIMSRLARAVGAEVNPMGWRDILDGAAVLAWKARGMQTIETPEQGLPETISREKQRKSGVGIERPPRTGSMNVPDQHPEEMSPAESVNYIFKQFLAMIENLTPEEIQGLLPVVVRSFEEFLAKALDQAAKKLIDRHEFETAYKIYHGNWNKKNGLALLAAPAIGLCLVQARKEFDTGNLDEARRWCNKGLYFDPRHQELLSLQSMAGVAR